MDTAMAEVMKIKNLTLKPIGIFRTSQVHPYEAGRQTDELSAEGVLELFSGENFEQALTGIEQCSHLWLIFGFHYNENWNPMVTPPRGPKMGVFATRSPHRPNPLGLSCVQLKERRGLKLTILGSDLLDGTPIYDIKPYLAYADSFPGVEPLWLQDSKPYSLEFSPMAENHLRFLQEAGVDQLRSFILHQLEFEPTNHKKKRVRFQKPHYVLAYRTWRAAFELDQEKIKVVKIYSGYTEADLQFPEDPYSDKELHRKFKTLFPEASAS
jgi:tRNA-Thr(GGU) m(6)t(6)A37 methyltransferase TsaA